MPEQRFIFAFGPYRLDTGKHSLSNGDEPVALEPLPFDVLVTLIESAPNLVTRKAFFDKHWAGVEVTDNVLDQAIATLRREFRRQPGGEGYVRTIKKRGFRFGVAVERLAAGADRQLQKPLNAAVL